MESGIEQYDYLIKALIIGDSSVGKTALLTRFTENHFSPSHVSTIGIDYKVKMMGIQDKVVKLQIWDTAGQERFRTITQTYYKGAMGIVLVYDSTNPESFSNIRNWLQQIKAHSPPSVAIMLVGNKCDLPNRKISESQGSELARDLEIQFIEASAKNDVNVKELFNKLAEEVIRKGLCLNLNSNTVKLSNKTQKIKGKCCKSK